MKRFKWTVAITAVFFMTVLLCSCKVTHIGTQQETHEPRLFGATYMTRNNPFFDVLHEAIKVVVESNGDILISRDPQQDQEKQNAQIIEMINEGIEVLFLNPVDWEAVKPALEACKKGGVIIINIDTVVKDREYVTSIIETDNYLAGVQCAQDMMSRIENARIVILDNPIQTSISNRVQGFLDTIKNNERYKVVFTKSGAGEIEVATNVMGDFLNQGIGFDVVFGGNDPSALGALAALQQNHMDNAGIMIYGIDGSPDFKSMLNLGYVTGTSAQSPKTIGTVAAETAYSYLAGNKVEEYISILPSMVTKENLSEYSINGWQ